MNQRLYFTIIKEHFVQCSQMVYGSFSNSVSTPHESTELALAVRLTLEWPFGARIPSDQSVQ